MKTIKGKSQRDWMKEDNSLVYPSLYIEESEIPEIEGWEVGKEYELKIRVKLTNKDEYADTSSTSARLEVLAYEDLNDYKADPSSPVDYGYNPNK